VNFWNSYKHRHGPDCGCKSGWSAAHVTQGPPGPMGPMGVLPAGDDTRTQLWWNGVAWKPGAPVVIPVNRAYQDWDFLAVTRDELQWLVDRDCEFDGLYGFTDGVLVLREGNWLRVFGGVIGEELIDATGGVCVWDLFTHTGTIMGVGGVVVFTNTDGGIPVRATTVGVNGMTVGDQKVLTMDDVVQAATGATTVGEFAVRLKQNLQPPSTTPRKRHSK
jgi:hypothetical protein